MFRLDPKQAVLDHVARKPRRGPGELGPEAQAIVAAPIEASYSGAVIIGIAQAIEALLLATLGFAIFATYVEPGQQAIYLPTIAARDAGCQRAVQRGADASHRGLSHGAAADRPRARGVVGGVHRADDRRLPVQGSELVSRVWLVSWFAAGALVLVVFRLSLRAAGAAMDRARAGSSAAR